MSLRSGVSTQSKLVDLLVGGHYWRKLLSQGSWYALTCVGQNKDTAVGAAKHSFGIEWMLARQLPNFWTCVRREGGELNKKSRLIYILTETMSRGQNGQIL